MSEVSKTIQEKTDDLNQLVSWFDSEDFILEQAVERFQQAEMLASEIENDLAEMKNTITVIKQKFDQDSV